MSDNEQETTAAKPGNIDGTPAYTSFQTMMNQIERMADDGGVPARIDRSYLSNLPGGVQSTMLQSMKSLGMIDADQHPTATLVELAEHADQRKAVIAGIVREKYDWAMSLGTRATQAQLESVFRERGLSGSTLRKAVAFFLAAARYADIPISPHFRTPRIDRSGNGSARNRRTQTPSPVVEKLPLPPAQPSALKHELIAGLIRELPEPGTAFPEEKQKAWFEIAAATFRLIYNKDDGGTAAITLTPGLEQE